MTRQKSHKDQTSSMSQSTACCLLRIQLDRVNYYFLQHFDWQQVKQQEERISSTLHLQPIDIFPDSLKESSKMERKDIKTEADATSEISLSTFALPVFLQDVLATTKEAVSLHTRSSKYFEFS